jgi:hypothetical protein
VGNKTSLKLLISRRIGEKGEDTKSIFSLSCDELVDYKALFKVLDFNPSADPNPVPFSKVEGKAVFEIPLVGYLILSPPLTFSILAVIVLGSLAAPR